MNINRALQILAKFFAVTVDTFERQSKEKLIEWATQVKQPNYQLTWAQHSFLIGRIKWL
jgi:hypothetical protein